MFIYRIHTTALPKSVNLSPKNQLYQSSSIWDIDNDLRYCHLMTIKKPDFRPQEENQVLTGGPRLSPEGISRGC